MSWRVIVIANEARLSLASDRLVIKQDEDIKIPLEDVGALILESNRLIVTTALLSALIAHNIAVFVCDERHVPSGVLLGYQEHSRQAKVIQMQIALSESFKKRVWQKLIQSKIQNQQVVLERISNSEHPEFTAFIKSVNSGDTLNREATASQRYFSQLYKGKMTRRMDSKINFALNYGYAVLRGVVARQLAGYGFMSSVGVHHKSELNNFNLADDFIEPYRPVVDYYVFSGKVFDNVDDNKMLSKQERANIVDILTKKVNIVNSKHSVLYSIDLMVKSFVTACNQKDVDKLSFPTIVFDNNDK